PTKAYPRSAPASDMDALLAFIDLRLALMPAVAAAKATTGRPVADPAQEARVLAAVRERAGQRGADPERIVALFRAQLAAARAIQEASLATPAAARPAVPAVDLETVRPALARLSDTIVDRAADVAADAPTMGPIKASAVAEQLDGVLIPAAHR